MLPKELVIKEYLMLRENQNQLIHILGKRDNEERDRDSNTILLLWSKIRVIGSKVRIAFKQFM